MSAFTPEQQAEIDAAVATIVAMNRALAVVEETGPSFWETETA